MAFEIVETTGSQRSVILRDRALPYRPVGWPGEQKYEKTVYPGNPVATIQVLGPDELETQIRGTWKTRYIAEMVTLWGFDDIATSDDDITAEIMEQVFTRIRRAGNEVEVRWEGMIRRGIMSKFDPSYQRVEDVEWTATFVWSQIGDRPAPRAASAENETQELAAAQVDLDDVMSRIPPILLPLVSNPAEVYADAIRTEVLSVITRVAAMTGIPDVPFEDWQGLAAAVAAVLEQGTGFRQLVIDGSIEDLVATDDIVDRLLIGRWRGDAGESILDVIAEAVRSRDTVRDRVAMRYLAVVVIKQNQSLRDLAREHYGDPDDWTVIADANGLVTSDPPVGTIVYIPRRATGSGRAA